MVNVTRARTIAIIVAAMAFSLGYQFYPLIHHVN